MKLITMIRNLPDFTKNSVLWTLLGSLNASALNAAARETKAQLALMTAAQAKAGKVAPISIDVYNEMVNELRQHQMSSQAMHEHGFETPDEEVEKKINFLDCVLAFRAPLLAMFHEVNSALPTRRDPITGKEMPAPDFSFEESLARQLAMEFTTNAAIDAAEEKALLDAGVVTEAELAEADKEAFEADQNFRREFKFLILDMCNSRQPEFTTVGSTFVTKHAVERPDGGFDVVEDEGFQDGGELVLSDDDMADAAFNALPEAYQHRLANKIIPKLESAKKQQIGRRSYDPDATSNIMLIGLALNELRKFVGPSDADKRLAAMKQALAA